MHEKDVKIKRGGVTAEKAIGRRYDCFKGARVCTMKFNSWNNKSKCYGNGNHVASIVLYFLALCKTKEIDGYYDFRWWRRFLYHFKIIA